MTREMDKSYRGILYLTFDNKKRLNSKWSHRETQGSASRLKAVNRLEALLDGLAGPEDIDLDLFFCHAEQSCDVLVGFTLKVAQLYAFRCFSGKLPTISRTMFT